LESQLEDEESARQKLMLDKKNLENKLKELQERFALMQDANERLQLEKKSVDNKLVQLSDLLQEGEDKAKQGMKYRQKVFLQNGLFRKLKYCKNVNLKFLKFRNSSLVILNSFIL